jgi:hypothetical protein
VARAWWIERDINMKLGLNLAFIALAFAPFCKIKYLKHSYDNPYFKEGVDKSL